MADPEIIAGRYEVRAAIGSGARGQVYLAHDPLLDTLVAIKMLHHNGADEAVVRFQKEAIATGKLKHPRIAQTLDFGIADGVLYMVMEFVDGESLEKLLESQTSLSVERALPLFIDICEGLVHAHGNGILHRDLKPANVIVVQTEEGEFAKLVDFGIAKIQGDDHVVTDPNAIVGSPIYMSPEQCKGEVCDARSDIYSLGCLMFETISGEPPFLGDTAIDTINLKTTNEAPSLSSVMNNSEIPEALVRIIKTCLRKDPGERYQNVQAIEQALDEIPIETKKLPDSFEPDSAARRRIAKPVLYVVSALVLVLLVAGQMARQILHENTVPDKSRIRALTNGLDTSQFYRASADMVDPLIPAKYTELRHDDSKTFALQVQNGLPPEFSAHQTKCFLIDPKFPNHIKATRSVRDQDFKQFIGKDYLRILEIDHAGSLSGSGMQYIEKLPLREIRITESMMKDVAIEHFCNIPTLEVLSIHDGINFTSAGFKNIGRLKQLHLLELTSSTISDQGVEYICEAKNIEILLLTRSAQITDDCIPAIISLPKLRSLALSQTGVTARGVTALARGSKSLSELIVNGLPWSDQSIEALAAVPNLTLLAMEDTDVTDDLIPKLAGMKKLSILQIEGRHLSANGVKALNRLPNLERLMLKDSDISLDLLKSLSGLKIKSLEFNRPSHLYDSQLFRLLDMPNLDLFELSDCDAKDVTFNGINEFQKRYSKKWKRDIKVSYDPRGLVD